MVIVLKRNASTEDIKKAILKFGKTILLKRSSRKQKIIDATFGKIFFDKEKSPLEIQKEMRDEWN